MLANEAKRCSEEDRRKTDAAREQSRKALGTNDGISTEAANNVRFQQLSLVHGAAGEAGMEPTKILTAENFDAAVDKLEDLTVIQLRELIHGRLGVPKGILDAPLIGIEQRHSTHRHCRSRTGTGAKSPKQRPKTGEGEEK